MNSYSDILNENWVDRYLPEWASPYARLMRLDRPIGTWLLLLPCFWGVAIAGEKLPDLWLLGLFTLGSIIMRGAGCTVNDICDRALDAQVERTMSRPLASGDVKLWQAVLFLLVLLLLGLAILLGFNVFTQWLGAGSLILVFLYPWMKRLTYWPQLFLGFTFNWGVLLGFAAVTGRLSLTPLLLYGGGVFWTLAYDTIYAHQDKIDDVAVGIKSTALLFGARSKRWVALFFGCAVVMIGLAGWSAGLGNGFYALLVLAGGFEIIQILAWRMDDPADCLLRFRANRDFGLLIFFGILLGKLQ